MHAASSNWIYLISLRTSLHPTCHYLMTSLIQLNFIFIYSKEPVTLAYIYIYIFFVLHYFIV